jgi:hypothetical protein
MEKALKLATDLQHVQYTLPSLAMHTSAYITISQVLITKNAEASMCPALARSFRYKEVHNSCTPAAMNSVKAPMSQPSKSHALGGHKSL